MSPLALLVEGLVAGAVPGLLAAGLALVHRTTGVLSFAHGAVGTVGAFVAWQLGSSEPSPGLLAGLGSAAIAMLGGAVCSLPLDPLCRRLGPERAALAIPATLGWGLLLEAALLLAYGSHPKAFLHIFADAERVGLTGGVDVARADLLLLVAVLAAVIVSAVAFRVTRVGLALRAVGADRAAAASLGLPVARLEMGAWAASGAAAGLSGWLLAPRLGLEPAMMWSPMVVGFVAAALGGIDRPGRALLAGLGLGVVERTAYLAVPPELAPALRWALLIGLLLLTASRRPPARP